MSEKEINHMIRVLPNYAEHLEYHVKSLIAKIYGIFTIQMDQFEPIHVMIMENSMPIVENAEMHYCFDMKGSSINREVLKSKTNSQLKNDAPTGGEVLKDLDYVRLNELKSFFNMENIDSQQILKQIELDVTFLM